ncbi:hypothetical protein ACJMK2_043824 [Sinanodonta woodiana]|uniref:CUB domain-containing protein n=1 Tax=Sinanodonta woodiana TaxID=1069815 RepID=A0ABD3VZD7_SINWO
MWSQINLLFLVLCFFTRDICCGGSKHGAHDNSDNHADMRGGDSHENDDEDPERKRNPTTLLVVIPVVGVLVLIILVICGICILKKYNHRKIQTQNYQEKGAIEKHQLAFPPIVSDNPPPYTPKMEEGEMKPAPMDFLGYDTHASCAYNSEHASSIYKSSEPVIPPGFICTARILAEEEKKTSHGELIFREFHTIYSVRISINHPSCNSINVVLKKKI